MNLYNLLGASIDGSLLKGKELYLSPQAFLKENYAFFASSACRLYTDVKIILIETRLLTTVDPQSPYAIII